MARPTPIARDVVCSVCDLPWKDHRLAPTDSETTQQYSSLEECVRLLKQRLATASFPRVSTTGALYDGRIT